MRLEIVIPIYNEEENLQELFEQINSEFSKLSYNYLINFIDDSSIDGSWSKIKKLSEKHKEVKGIQLSRNFGHQAAIDAGVSNFSSDVVFLNLTKISTSAFFDNHVPFAKEPPNSNPNTSEYFFISFSTKL